VVAGSDAAADAGGAKTAAAVGVDTPAKKRGRNRRDRRKRKSVGEAAAEQADKAAKAAAGETGGASSRQRAGEAGSESAGKAAGSAAGLACEDAAGSAAKVGTKGVAGAAGVGAAAAGVPVEPAAAAAASVAPAAAAAVSVGVAAAGRKLPRFITPHYEDVWTDYWVEAAWQLAEERSAVKAADFYCSPPQCFWEAEDEDEGNGASFQLRRCEACSGG
jgi:hypothetical protein